MGKPERYFIVDSFYPPVTPSFLKRHSWTNMALNSFLFLATLMVGIIAIEGWRLPYREPKWLELLQLRRKVKTIADFNDVNGDGTITIEEVRSHLSTNFDTDGNGIYSKQECVHGTVCLYDDTPSDARKVCGLIFG